MTMATERHSTTKRVAMNAMRPLALASALWCAMLSTASADVFGYVDPNGQLHLATEKLDDRYTLFLKARDGASSVSIDQEDKPRTIDPSLMKTRLFQRLVDHPNIAKYEPLIRTAAQKHGLDPQLVKAVIAVESGFDAGAVSDKGAVGLMQVLPATGERYGVHADRKKSVDAKLTDPRLNVEIGTRYLSDLLVMFPNRLDLALAAYNAGENSVIHYRNAIPPFRETQAYVKLVDQFHAFYSPAPSTTKANSNDRIRVTIPGRRNLPDPNAMQRLPPPGPDADATPAASESAGVDSPSP
jgi:soluble lytic murein transglycosylase-like protein